MPSKANMVKSYYQTTMQRFTIKELDDKDSFDTNTLISYVPFTQTRLYGTWQQALGRRVRRFVVIDESATVAYFQSITYPLMRGLTYVYIPYGPVMSTPQEDLIVYLKEVMATLAREERAVFVRLDSTPEMPSDLVVRYFTKAPRYTYHSAYFQPRYEWYLDLTPDEDTLFACMHKNTRYSIRVAEKKEIVTQVVTQDFMKYFDIFYDLMVETSTRNGFSLHAKEYYRHIFESLTSENAYLVIAGYKETTLVVDLFITANGIANYVFSGSSSTERDRMPSYAAQWHAIRHAKQQGCHVYNFGGISKDDGVYSGWEGLTSFKKKFGGRGVEHSQFFDYVASPVVYRLYNLRKMLKQFHT